MDTCVICHNAFDPIWNENGNLLIDYETGICIKCQQKIADGELDVEDYDKHDLDGKK